MLCTAFGIGIVSMKNIIALILVLVWSAEGVCKRSPVMLTENSPFFSVNEFRDFQPTDIVVNHPLKMIHFQKCLALFENELNGQNFGEFSCNVQPNFTVRQTHGFLRIIEEATLQDEIIDPLSLHPELAESSWLDGIFYDELVNLGKVDSPTSTPPAFIKVFIEMDADLMVFTIEKYSGLDFIPFTIEDLDIAEVMVRNLLQKSNYKIPVQIQVTPF